MNTMLFYLEPSQEKFAWWLQQHNSLWSAVPLSETNFALPFIGQPTLLWPSSYFPPACQRWSLLARLLTAVCGKMIYIHTQVYTHKRGGCKTKLQKNKVYKEQVRAQLTALSPLEKRISLKRSAREKPSVRHSVLEGKENNHEWIGNEQSCSKTLSCRKINNEELQPLRHVH